MKDLPSPLCGRLNPSASRLTIFAMLMVLVAPLTVSIAGAAELADAIERVKPSIVGIATLLRTRSPAVQFSGTGFAVADGHHVVTNAHVVARTLDGERNESWIALLPGTDDPQPREAKVLGIDSEHDLAVLRISGEPLRALRIGDSDRVREGQALALTGFPLGLVLGFRPVTHRATLAAITPAAVPGPTSRQLRSTQIARLRDAPYFVFQLDGTAYPGNSGSPLYDPDTVLVLGVINSVFVQGTRENVVRLPSGITYAVPARHVLDLLRRERVPGIE